MFFGHVCWWESLTNTHTKKKNIKNTRFLHFTAHCEWHGMWMGVGCPCPPVRNYMVTPRLFFFLFIFFFYLFFFLFLLFDPLGLTLPKHFLTKQTCSIEAHGHYLRMVLRRSANCKKNLHCQGPTLNNYHHHFTQGGGGGAIFPTLDDLQILFGAFYHEMVRTSPEHKGSDHFLPWTPVLLIRTGFFLLIGSLNSIHLINIG